MSAITQALLYAGLEKGEIESLLPEARAENGHRLTIYSSMITVIFAACLLVSVLAGGKLVVNRPIYIAMIAVGATLYLCAKLVLPRRAAWSTLFANIFIVALYWYSFSVSLLYPDMQGVAAVAILLVMPSLFNYRPVYMIVMTVAAQAVIDRFGQENTFRIGGDEFVAFCMDAPVEEVRDRIRAIIRDVTDAGYSVSVGGARQDKGELDTRGLVKEAEMYMYKEKRSYYEQSSHDRRNRILAG